MWDTFLVLGRLAAKLDSRFVTGFFALWLGAVVTFEQDPFAPLYQFRDVHSSIGWLFLDAYERRVDRRDIPERREEGDQKRAPPILVVATTQATPMVPKWIIITCSDRELESGLTRALFKSRFRWGIARREGSGFSFRSELGSWPFVRRIGIAPRLHPTVVNHEDSTAVGFKAQGLHVLQADRYYPYCTPLGTNGREANIGKLTYFTSSQWLFMFMHLFAVVVGAHWLVGILRRRY